MASVRPVETSVPIPTCTVCGLFHATGTACPIMPALPAAPDPQTLPRGTVLGGRFEIERVTHRSGMSTVYRARIHGQRRPQVAIKQFSVGDLSPGERLEALGWLAREAGMLSQLRNPHLPELLAAFNEGDEQFIVMPYLEGETIKDLVRTTGPLSENDTLQWSCVLAEVLAYLHGQDPPVIHRDLKPDNVLILPGRQVMLLDLGVARHLSRGVPGTAIGTPGYAPPEQYQGLADERSDLYALGATMHYMLTGYDAEQETPFRHPPVRQLRPDVSPALAQIVESLLSLPPDRRPSSAMSVANDIARIVDTPVLAFARSVYLRTLRNYLSSSLCLAAVSGIVALAGSGSAALFVALLPQIMFCSAVVAFRPIRNCPVPETSWGDAVLEATRWRTGWMLASAIFTYTLAFLLGREAGGLLALLTCFLTIGVLVHGWTSAEETTVEPGAGLYEPAYRYITRLRP